METSAVALLCKSELRKLGTSSMQRPAQSSRILANPVSKCGTTGNNQQQLELLSMGLNIDAFGGSEAGEVGAEWTRGRPR